MIYFPYKDWWLDMEKCRILILTDRDSWIRPYVNILMEKLQFMGYEVYIEDQFPDEKNFELCFMLSYSKIVSKEILTRSRHNLVVHESDLPQGKGWSPMTWQILEGKNIVPVTLFEATECVDAGQIYMRRQMVFKGNELLAELHQRQGETTVEMCLEFVNNYPEILLHARPQKGEESFYPKRTPNDSKLDINSTIKEQFNLFRVVDNKKYPAWFEYRGKKYRIEIYAD